MYAYFELKLGSGGVMINPDQVVTMSPVDDDETVIYTTTGGTGINVNCSIETARAQFMLAKMGCRHGS